MNKLQFNSFTKNIDGQEYCSEVETLAENMIESNEKDATIVYPAPGQWATFRAENLRLITDGLAIVLPYPIYKIKSLKIKPNGLKVGSGSLNDYTLNGEEDGETFIVEGVNLLITDEEYTSLPLPITYGYAADIVPYMNKGTTMPYTKNSKTIKLLSTVYTYRNPNNAAIEIDFPVFEGFIAKAIFDDPRSENYYINDFGTIYKLRDHAALVIGSDNNDPRLWEFQIEYIPMTSATKMKAHKAEPTTQGYTQVVNQRAEVNNAEAFGKYLHTTAQKTGTEKLAIAKIYKRLKDVPPIGAVVKHNGERYRLIANSWNITNPFTFTVTHLLSKNWSSKSKHIAVDQKYRNWNIPFDSYIWRTLYREFFVEIGDRMTAGGGAPFTSRSQCIKDIFTTDAQTVQPLRNMFFYNGEGGESTGGVVLPTTTMAIGNSFIISATMQDNLSAGLRISATNSEFCEEVLYCNEDGTLDKARVVLSHQLINYDAAAYPAIITGDNPKNTAGVAVYGETLYVDKDPGEALKITIQTHFLPNADWVVIGNALAQTVPYISDKQRTFKLYALKQYIRDGVDKLDTETLYGSFTLVEDDGTTLKHGYFEDGDWINADGTVFNPSTFSDIVLCNGSRLSFHESADLWMDVSKNEYKAWAITDEDNNLLIGSNDINKRTVYFNWTKTRSKK